MLRVSVFFGALALTMNGASASAATAKAEVRVTATVVAACSVGTPAEQSALSIRCTQGTPYQVSLGGRQSNRVGSGSDQSEPVYSLAAGRTERDAVIATLIY